MRAGPEPLPIDFWVGLDWGCLVVLSVRIGQGPSGTGVYNAKLGCGKELPHPLHLGGEVV